MCIICCFQKNYMFHENYVWHKMFLLCNKRRNSAFPVSVRKYSDKVYSKHKDVIEHSSPSSSTSQKQRLHPFKPFVWYKSITPKNKTFHSGSRVNWNLCRGCWHRHLSSQWGPGTCASPRGCGQARRGQVITSASHPATRLSAVAFGFINTQVSLGWGDLGYCLVTSRNNSASGQLRAIHI